MSLLHSMSTCKTQKSPCQKKVQQHSSQRVTLIFVTNSVKIYCFRTMLVSQLNAFQNCLRLPQPWLWASDWTPYLLKAVFSGSCSLGGKAPLMLCVGGGWWDDELAFLNKSSMVIDCCLWTIIEKVTTWRQAGSVITLRCLSNGVPI